MANKVRKVPLDPKEIQKTIRDLKKMQKELNALPSDIEEILDEAVAYCKSITPISDKDGNHLRDNTYWEKTPKGYRIVQEGEGVAFVEFGTGEVGELFPHEKAGNFGWVYGVGEHIFTTKDGKRGWFFPTDGEDGAKTFRFTEGQPANMQMYKTSLWLKEKLNARIRMRMERVKNIW